MGWSVKVAVIGTSIFLFGFIFGFYGFHKFLKSQIAKNAALVEGTDMRANWAKTPIAVEFRIYLFNVTNPEEVHKGAKPILQEVGPFCYDEWKEKVGFSDDPDEDEVSFHMKNTWIFNKDCYGNAEEAGLTGEEMITVPNAALLSLALMVEKDTPALLTMANRGIPHLYNHQKTVFVTAKAKEILFEGIYLNCTSKDFAAVALCTGIRMNAKGLHKINDNLFKFSFFGVKNGTADEARLTVKRGKENIKDLGRVVALNGKPEMKVWDAPECNQIVGTDTTIFPPFTQSSEDLISFSPDVCRSMGAKYQRPSSYKGIKTNYYTANLGDMSKNPEEKCFCPTPTTCHKKGIFDITKCTGAPIWLSLPHFYETDPFYLSQVEGLSPDMQKHQIFVEFEPFTGTPLAARKRMQFNIPIHKIKKIELMRDLPDALIPIFWIEEGLELGDEYIDLLENKLFRTMRMVGVARWVMLIVGLAMIGFGGYSYFANTQTVDLVKQPAPPAEKHSASSVSPRY